MTEPRSRRRTPIQLRTPFRPQREPDQRAQQIVFTRAAVADEAAYPPEAPRKWRSARAASIHSLAGEPAQSKHMIGSASKSDWHLIYVNGECGGPLTWSHRELFAAGVASLLTPSEARHSNRQENGHVSLCISDPSSSRSCWCKPRSRRCVRPGWPWRRRFSRWRRRIPRRWPGPRVASDCRARACSSWRRLPRRRLSRGVSPSGLWSGSARCGSGGGRCLRLLQQQLLLLRFLWVSGLSRTISVRILTRRHVRAAVGRVLTAALIRLMRRG